MGLLSGYNKDAWLVQRWEIWDALSMGLLSGYNKDAWLVHRWEIWDALSMGLLSGYILLKALQCRVWRVPYSAY
jgi:hypothetical protein